MAKRIATRLGDFWREFLRLIKSWLIGDIVGNNCYASIDAWNLQLGFVYTVMRAALYASFTRSRTRWSYRVSLKENHIY